MRTLYLIIALTTLVSLSGGSTGTNASTPAPLDEAKLELALQHVDRACVRYMQEDLKMAVDVEEQDWLQRLCVLARDLRGKPEWTVMAASPLPTVTLYAGDRETLQITCVTQNHVTLAGDGWAVNLEVKDGLLERYLSLCRAKQELREKPATTPPVKVDVEGKAANPPNQALLPTSMAVTSAADAPAAPAIAAADL